MTEQDRGGAYYGMEIIKQLYDVMTLIEVAEDFTEVRETYYSLVQDEIAYRGLDIGPGDALRDTYNAILVLLERKFTVNGEVQPA